MTTVREVKGAFAALDTIKDQVETVGQVVARLYDKIRAKKSSKIDHALLRQGSGIRMYKELSLPAQKAIYRYMAIDGEAWANLRNIRQAREAHGDCRFGVGQVPLEHLVTEIMKTPDIRGQFSCFSDYHAWYVSFNAQPELSIARRSVASLWPVILSPHSDEVLEDGWHRFHAYVTRPLWLIPAVYYLKDEEYF